MRLSNTPIISSIGLIIFALTFTMNMVFKYSRTSDVGIAMLLSLVNAVLLFFTLLWVVLGIIELKLFVKSYKDLRNRTEFSDLGKDEYNKKIRRLRLCFLVNLCYLVVFICQLGYVIFNWDEINI